ncbi:MAG: ferric reductase-like transmembrane domain-containing protein [Anaerolineales bacterium]|nr:ferric reductase-like transmembrane domain-containing protein [Anaerolineales bacterium]MCB8950675.1 ferric reductase-like transmembrane domain-containing protein [Ardenticatenales bacterium]
MSPLQANSSRSVKKKDPPYGWIALTLIALFVAGAGLVLASPQGAAARSALNWLLLLDTQNSAWFVTRSAGILSYLLVWLSTAWGLAIPTKLIDRILHRGDTFEFHQFISLLSFGFLALHIFILAADQYLPYSLAQMFIPFLSPYRPLWVGVGIIAFYLLLLVTVTFYMRQRIGMKAFRAIHYSSLLAYLGATAHGLMAGTDSSLPMTLLMYGGTFLVIVFLTTYWLVMVWQGKRASVQKASATA